MTGALITSADGTSLAARHSGAGTPIVLVHGALGNIDSFVLVEPLLAERHQVWVYSWRGHVGSGETDDYSVARQAEDLLAVIECAGGDVHLCGWSAGAVYALAAAQHGTALRSLILYEPPLKLGDELVRTMLAELTAALDAGDPDMAIERFFPYAGVTPTDAALLRAQSEFWEQLRDGVCPLGRELQAMLDGPVDNAGFEASDVPTLYLYGDDTVSPSFLSPAEAAAAFPRAMIRALPGQRHLAQVADPIGFATQVIEFTAAADGFSC